MGETRRIPWSGRRLSAGLLITGGVVAGCWGLDRAAADLVARLTPSLETSISRPLGHPIELGEYRGLLPWGVAIGRSRILPAEQDRSQVSVSGLTIRFDPIASLRHWKPVLRLHLQGAVARLSRNAAGGYWIPGRGLPGSQPPRLDLRYSLGPAARIELAPSGQTLLVGGRFSQNLDARTFSTALRLGWSDQKGGLRLEGRGRWDRSRLDLHGRMDGLALDRLAALVSPRDDLRISGRLDGDLRLQWRQGRPACRGSLRLRELEVRSASLPDPLTTPQLALGCRDRTVSIARSRISSGDWTLDAVGDVILQRSLDLRLRAQRKGHDDDLDIRMDGPWAAPRWRLAGQLDLPEQVDLKGPLQIKAQLRMPWTDPAAPRVEVEDLQLQAPGARLRLAGSAYPRLDLTSRELALTPELWKDNPSLVKTLGPESAVNGGFRLSGTLQKPELAVDLRMRAGASRLHLVGDAYPRLNLISQDLSLAPPLWSAVPALRTSLGQTGTISGKLMATGPLAAPAFSLELQQGGNPFLERWNLKAGWSAASSLLVLDRFNSPLLDGSGQLPLALGANGLETGALQAGLNLKPLALDRFSDLAGVSLGGTIAARGRLQGPLDTLRPDLALELTNPRVGALQLAERWKGRMQGALGQDLTLALESRAHSGSLRATLGSDGWPRRVQVQRDDGALELQAQGGERRYRWNAEGFPLDGLQVILAAQSRSEGLSGRLDGSGELRVSPFLLSGSLSLDQPTAFGVNFTAANLSGRLAEVAFQLQGDLQPPEGQVGFTATGRLGGALSSRADAEGLSVPWLVNLARQLRNKDPLDELERGRAEDLGRLVINTFGGSLDGQLKALALSRQALLDYERDHPQKGIDPSDLRGRVDGTAILNGPDLAGLNLDLQARGHLWLDGADRDLALQLEPFVASIQGPLRAGEGRFQLLHLPFSLLALFGPLPSTLRGALGVTGRYRLDARGGPLIDAELALEQAALGDSALRLERRSIVLNGDALNLDLALRASKAGESITIVGAVPLQASSPLDVQIESHGDALNFLTALSGDSVELKRGAMDLRLMLRGTLEQPQANGFLVMDNLDLRIRDQQLRRLRASVLFDFNRLEIQSLEAQLASGGQLRGRGSIGLFDPVDEPDPLTLELVKARIEQEALQVVADAKVTLSGVISRPVISGEISLDQGGIRPRGGLLSRLRPGRALPSTLSPGIQDASSVVAPVQLNTLMQEKWDFQEPLVLFGPGVPVAAPDQLNALLPNLPAIQFRNLRLRLGPNLSVDMPPLVSFRGGGQLLLNGPLDPSLKVRGLIRLNSGRISLFSSTFRLDHRAPNVAVFTPALGLVPFVDIAMKSRISDSVGLSTIGSSESGSIFEESQLGALDAVSSVSGGNFQLIRVTVEAIGPANRLRENLVLRSSPRLSESQLLALIGGNSLTMLSGGGASAALATVLGQSLLSPVLGTLTDAMGQRLQVALYPTYVTPEVKTEDDRTSGRVPPTFALMTEFGVDITDRFDVSVLAAPNNTDVPPKASVSYQISPSTSISGAVDVNGTWQSQLQVFFRF